MSNKKYNTMVFCKDNYISPYTTTEEVYAKMYKDIGDFLRILFKNEQVAVIYEEEVGIVVVEYDHDERRDFYGIANPQWITEDELSEIESKDENGGEE